jgi:CelD/BcsL family acetyltransferase involved in cellulose biosynthesis
MVNSREETDGMTADLHVQVHTFETAPTTAQWNALLARSSSNLIFLTRPYQEAWWRAVGPSADCSCTLRILALSEGDNLVGLAPFSLAPLPPTDVAEEAERRPGAQRAQARAGQASGELPVPGAGERVVRLIGGVAVTDYLDIIAPPALMDAAWRAILGYWAVHADEWDAIDLRSLPAESPSRRIVPRLAAERGWHSWCEVEETCPAVALPADWETYLAGLGKKDRHELRRKLRKAESAPMPITWRLVKDAAALPAAVDTFIALHQRSSADKADFMDAAMVGFFRSLPAVLGELGWLEVALLDVAGEPAAAYLSFDYGGRIYLYNSGYEPRFGEWSTGLVLLARRIQAAIAAGVPCFDFLRGDERYKYDLGGADHFVYRVLVRRDAVTSDER